MLLKHVACAKGINDNGLIVQGNGLGDRGEEADELKIQAQKLTGPQYFPRGREHNITSPTSRVPRTSAPVALGSSLRVKFIVVKPFACVSDVLKTEGGDRGLMTLGDGL